MTDFTRELTMLEDPRPRCPICRSTHDRWPQRYCLECHAAYMRQHRPRYAELSEQERAKVRTRSRTGMLVRQGKLVRRPCWCGRRAEAHHPDYDRPCLVVWLCHEHHVDLHVWMGEQRPR